MTTQKTDKIINKEESSKTTAAKYKQLEERYKAKHRSLIIIRDLADFLRLPLDHKQKTEILDVMLVRFTIEATQASRGSIIKVDRRRNLLQYSHTFTYHDGRLDLTNYGDKLKNIEYKVGENICGICYGTQSEIVVPDVSKEPFYIDKTDKKLGMKTHSVICMPIMVGDEVDSVIELTRSEGEFHKEEVEEMLRIIINLIATSMENAQNFQWAITDSLTQLFNIHYFNKMFDNELKRANRYQSQLSLMIIDLDDFKSVNDTYGHKVGDKVLKKLSSILTKTTRNGVDIPGRYGGDEFVMLLPSTKKEDAKLVARKIITAVRKARVAVDKKNISFTVSIGIASYPDHGETANVIFEAADSALYVSKAGGKNNFSLYDDKEGK